MSNGVGDDISDTEVEISRDSLRFGGGGFGFLSLSSPDELVDWSELVDGEGEIDRELRICCIELGVEESKDIVSGIFGMRGLSMDVPNGVPLGVLRSG